MDEIDFEHIQDISERRVRETSTDIKRFLYDRIDWSDRLIAILGSRGTGKTTLLLQHIKDEFKSNRDVVLYASLDNIWFKTHDVMDMVDYHYKHGGRYIFLDEVHHLEDWQIIIKNIYDDYPRLNIVYTGSSLLKLDNDGADLSRRQIVYNIPGLSFREYLYFEGKGKYSPVTFSDIRKNHVEIAEEIAEKTEIIALFDKYLETGYYPFYKEVHAGYEERLLQVIDLVLKVDYPAIETVSYATIEKVKKMLYILAQSCPQTPNMAELYRELMTDRNQGMKMLYSLDRANLLNLISSEKATLKNMARPDKIYCDNTNLMYSLTEHIDIGTKRETFFLNQVKSAGLVVQYPKNGDFLVDNQYLFEVGGRRKTFDQIKDIPNSYLAIDDEEVGRRNKIPLWMFGFLY